MRGKRVAVAGLSLDQACRRAGGRVDRARESGQLLVVASSSTLALTSDQLVRHGNKQDARVPVTRGSGSPRIRSHAVSLSLVLPPVSSSRRRVFPQITS